MRLLFITETLDKDDESASYVHSQLMDLAQCCSSLSVIVLENRSHSLPDSVRIISLGKEQGLSRTGYLRRLYAAVFGEKYDAVYVNRTPLYIVLCGPFWKLMGKRVYLAYNHRFKDWKLRYALLFTNQVLSPSLSGFPLASKKVRVMPSSELGEFLCK